MATCDLNQFFSDLCLSSLDNESQWTQLAVEIIVMMYAFDGLAVSADHMCNSMETLCDHWNIPPDVGGATFMAFGSALPEITVNAITTLQTVSDGKAPDLNSEDVTKAPKNDDTVEDPSDLGVGAILGSGLIAFLLIPSICALSAPKNLLVLERWPLLRDTCCYATALGVLVYALHFNNADIYISSMLVGVYAMYLIVLFISKKLQSRLLQRSVSVFRERYEGHLDEPLLQDLYDFLDDAEKEKWTLKNIICGVFGLIRIPNHLIDFTCIDCRINEKYERYYALTFIVSFAWISVFSSVVTVVADRWVDKLAQPGAMGFFGLCLVAVGAEIPDTIAAVTVAKRGYGAMATSSCIGSQIINICIGLGLPWTLAILYDDNTKGMPIGENDPFLHLASKVQLANCMSVGTLLVGSSVILRRRVQVTKYNAMLFGTVYVSLILFFGYYTFVLTKR